MYSDLPSFCQVPSSQLVPFLLSWRVHEHAYVLACMRAGVCVSTFLRLQRNTMGKSPNRRKHLIWGSWLRVCLCSSWRGARQKADSHDCGTVADSLCFTQKLEAGSLLKKVWAFEISKPHPVICLQQIHTSSSLPNSSTSCGISIQIYMTLWGLFSFKPP